MGTTIDASKISSLMSVLQSTGLSNSAFGKNASFINSVFTSGYSIYQGYASGDTDSQVQATINVVSLLTSLLQKFTCNETSTATKEVAKGQKDIAEGTSKVIEFERTGNAEIDACLTRIEAELKNVQNVTNAITEKSQEVQAANEQLDAQKQIISDNIRIVNAFNGSSDKTNEDGNVISDKDPSVVNSALTAIEGAEGQIRTIAGGIAKMVQFIAEQNGILTESTTNVATQLESAQGVVVKTLENMSNETAKTAAASIKDTAKMGAEGATNNAVGAAAQTVAAGSTASSLVTLGATAGIAVKAEQLSIDQIGAGATRIGGVATNMTALGSSLGTAGEEMATVASYAQTIGAAAVKSVELVGQAGVSLGALITATGSWASVLTDAETIKSAVDTYKENMNSDNGNNTLNLDPANLFQKVINANASETK